MKLKLGHYDCEKALSDVLVDFPVEVILQRPGLIEAVLDIVGSIFPAGAQGSFHSNFLDIANMLISNTHSLSLSLSDSDF